MNKPHDLRKNYLDITARLVANGGPEPDEYDLYLQVIDTVTSLDCQVHKDLSALDEFRNHLGPALSTATLQGLSYFKPRGYAGDFQIIDRIYQNWVSADPDFVKWDRFFQEQTAPITVRNRKSYFIDLLEYFYQTRESSLKILNVGSGSCRDLLEFLMRGRPGIHFTCVELDGMAIDYATKLLGKHKKQVGFHQGHALKADTDAVYDFIWSGGLFDYFSDRVFIFGLRRLFSHLSPGGRLIIGNFSESNPTRNYMEVVGDWYLKYRNKDSLLELFSRTGIKHSRAWVEESAEGVNLFLNIEK